MSDPVAWLDGRDPPAPAMLRDVMAELLEGTAPSDPLPDRFAAAALAALEAAVRQPSQRRTAPILLAGDALLTYACEAAVEAGLDELERITAELDLDRFSRLLPSTP